ncbi:ankyrin repeat-containing protein ITN1-like isoform X1 [Arachis stenosperma]|uniref:ankyrin repeat-containing protein ITN1-like isoform X1 n=2 Tax=Arachis stenosperma TaxID=217475 RepID=UPI0025ABCE29|nr:ankyrin repeat-containing protein ITN1-like isoform X1 [Arachis stenosperma]
MAESERESIKEQISMFDEKMISAQRAARSENWREFKKLFEVDRMRLLDPLDLFGNTAIHIATHSDNPNLLQELLELLPRQERWRAMRMGNCVNNTLLHEIVFCTTVDMAGVVFKLEKELQEEVESYDPLVEVRNDSGESPLFRAAKLGKLKMLKYMANHVVGDIRSHFVRFDRCSILHACILGQFFDVAIWLLKLDGNLAQHKDMDGLTCLQLLANMPLVFRSQTPSMGAVKNLVYYLLPDEGYEIDDDYDEKGEEEEESVSFRLRTDLESGPLDKAKQSVHQFAAFSRINYAIWKILAKEFNGIGHIWQKKKQHKLAECLAELLVQKDFSWQISFHSNFQPLIVLPILSSKLDRIKEIQLMKEKRQLVEIAHSRISKPLLKESISEASHFKNYTPLLMAAGSGIVEIVEKIIDMNPEAISHVSQDEHNVLHMAVKHRQLKIFNLIKRNSAFKSLIHRITGEGRTLLHQVARMEFYKEQRLPGVAFQLQDELRWYERVRRIVPPHYLMHCDKDGLTAKDVLEMEHQDMHKEAKSWIKETAQSCSTVAVLVATVVFAAAYTIPGGSQNGTPVFFGSRVFLFFTITDVVALVSSLASVVMFLSILTSPFELWDFYKSLPRKLSLGFALLFFSLVCTMLAFSATVLLTIRLDNKEWTSILFYCAGFLPVAIFAWMQFPLYKTLQKLVRRLYNRVKQV